MGTTRVVDLTLTDRELTAQRNRRFPAQIHESKRLHEDAFGPIHRVTGKQKRSVSTYPPIQRNQGIQDEPTHVVASPRVGRPRVPQTDHSFHAVYDSSSSSVGFFRFTSSGSAAVGSSSAGASSSTRGAEMVTMVCSVSVRIRNPSSLSSPTVM